MSSKSDGIKCHEVLSIYKTCIRRGFPQQTSSKMYRFIKMFGNLACGRVHQNCKFQDPQGRDCCVQGYGHISDIVEIMWSIVSDM